MCTMSVDGMKWSGRPSEARIKRRGTWHPTSACQPFSAKCYSAEAWDVREMFYGFLEGLVQGVAAALLTVAAPKCPLEMCQLDLDHGCRKSSL